jgi:Tfp pilus assembly protein PilF
LLRLALILAAALILIGAGAVMNLSGKQDLGTSDPEAAEFYQRGLDHFHAFQYNLAREQLEAAIAQDPDFAAAVAALAVVHSQSGSRAAADSLAARADSLAAAIEDDDQRMLVQLKLASYHLGGHVADRDSLLEILKKHRPHDIDVLYARTLKARAENDQETLGAIWQEILKRNPNHAAAYNELGYHAYYAGDYERAIDLLQRYAYLAPDLANPHDSLGDVLMHVGRYEEAEQEFRKALAKQPDFMPSIFNLARVYVERGQLKKGIDLLESLRGRTAGTRYESHVDELAIATYYTYHLHPELEQAVARYVEHYPETPQALFYRTMMLAGRGDAEAANALMDSTMTALQSQYGKDGSPRIERQLQIVEAQMNALLRESADDAAGAEKYWGRALELTDPGSPIDQRFLREQYAACLLQNGKPQEALSQVHLVLEENPRQLRSLALAAEACIALDRRGQAKRYVELLEKAIGLADETHPLRKRLEGLQRELHGKSPSS